MLAVFLDDGPLARLLRRGRQEASVLSTATGVAALAAGVLVDGSRTSIGTGVGAVLLVALATLDPLRRPEHRLRWLVPPLLRLAEYGLMIALAGRAGGPALPLAYVLLAVLAYHHYELVYRVREAGTASPRWIALVTGGWELRMLVLVAAAAVGWLPTAMGALAGWLAIMYLGETIVWWHTALRRERLSIAGDESR